MEVRHSIFKRMLAFPAERGMLSCNTLKDPAAVRMESNRGSCESPPASHMGNPPRLVCLMKFRFAKG